ncbi:MAG: citrate/2-methylcitrate synthase [Verrucomicrobia bacterium]|jgi:citrate synthase|nr:citrate/2-methylcitrate synthase [Verrucomicrobiota bacterium]
MKEAELVQLLSEKATANNAIDNPLYEKFSVKRGLRNADSTGVLVGLTNIGEVRGYVIEENEKIPREGRLLYRGFDVAELVTGFQADGRLGFEEICFLLLFGELPTSEDLAAFSKLLGELRALPDNFTEDMILKIPSHDIMNKLARSILVSYSYDMLADSLDVRNVLYQCLKLIARFPTMVAYGYQAMARNYENKSLYLHNPDPETGASENFLRMIRPDASFSRLEAETLDLALVLHAEHGGGNNSTFTVHVVASSHTDTYSAIAAAVGSLKGPRHGGASLRVREMMNDLDAECGENPSDATIASYLERIMDKKAFDGSGLIYGMGHAVYTLSDPRAVMLKAKARELAEEKGMLARFAVYDAVERLSPDIFRSKKDSDAPLCANVDLYSGLVYRMLGLPESLYTPLFAIARIAGWSAHRIEQIVSAGKIMRPAYKCVQRRGTYSPISDRS